MRPICWLHISDIHLRSDKKWQQDVVLKAMCRNIGEQREAGTAADFILVTGDIAFSGKSKEYELAASFFNDLQATSGVPKERIYCIAGNHDIDRDRQDLCFRGARTELRSVGQVDAFLEGGENFNTLLLRQDNYRQFQQSYFEGQERTETADGLGYVSRLEINEIQLAIVGLDSAWLAEGGKDDRGELLIGERQAINAIESTLGAHNSPNIIVGMAHHPLHLLQDFDRQPVQNRIEEEFHFFHCGHLHEPEVHITGPGGTGCLTLVAGASFETRQARNAYYMVNLDLLHSIRNVKSVQYNPTSSTFSLTSSDDYPIEVTPVGTCGVGELAAEIQSYCSAIAPWVHYLSALVLSQKAEFPIPSQNGYTFGSLDLLLTLPDSDLKQKTTEFMTFKNILDVLYNRKRLSEILVRHGDSIRKYGEALTTTCESDSTFKERLEYLNKDSRLLADSKPWEVFSHTRQLLDDLAAEQDWLVLREQAKRHVDSSDPTVASKAKRMMALALANSDEPQDKEKAIKYYQSLVECEMVDFTDIGNLAILLVEVGRMADASLAILEGIKMFQEKTSYFAEIGQKIVEMTGNRELRLRIKDATRGQT